MKKLVIVRHSKAEEHRFGMRDFDRKLAKRGLKEASFIAEKLKENKLIPDLIISSTAARAFQSSLHHVEVFQYPKDKIMLLDSIYDHFDVDDLRAILVDSAEEAACVFLFGHNPTLSNLAYDLSGGFNEFLPTSGAIGIAFEINQWSELRSASGKVLCFEYPKKYE
jgi:phosphohistidine phosphatase